MSSTGSPGPSTSTANGGSSKMLGILKRTTAANFFNRDEESEKVSEHQSTTYDVVVELLNNAAIMARSSEKIANLRKVQELIIHHSPDLLDNFLDEMLAYQSDSSTDVKKFIIGFMEEACKKDNDCLPKVLPNMIMLLGDDDINVQKKVILTVSSMFKLTLTWISKAKKATNDMLSVWNHLFELKNLLYDLLESENDGIRTHAVKFLEGLTLVFSRKMQDSEGTKKNDIDMSLEQVPESNGIVKISQLEEEGKRAFNCLLQFQSSPHISSINLMTVMNALSTIAKQRPEYFDQVVQSFEALHVNLPPTLAKSQVSSVRKNLKTQMMSLLKHPASVDFLPQITTLLIDLGASQSEITKNTPKDTDSRKRKAQESSASSSSKKLKQELDDDDGDGATPWVDRSTKKNKMEPLVNKTAIDVTAEDILPRLNAQNVTDLVLLSMVMLPDTMPALFQSTYTPIAAAGTQAQISHIARLLSTQLTMAGMGKGLGELQMRAMKEEIEMSNPDDEPASPKQVIQTVVGRKYDEEDFMLKRPKISQLPLPPPVKKIKQFQLPAVTNRLDVAKLDTLHRQTMNRILQAEKAASVGHVEHHRVKLMATITTLSGPSAKMSLKEYIFSDLRNRQDLAFSWLYQEFAFCQAYSANHLSANQSPGLASYDECFTGLLTGLLETEDHHGDSLFHRLILEAPAITNKALAIMGHYCLTTSEVMEALPKLIKLNPMVVKEVFNRLMGSHVSNDSAYHSPLTPVELLVALHNIDSAKCDIKTTIKAANLCFSERNIYTQEVLAIVMQQLMEQDPLPTLLMRTVIQSLSMYPRLIGFVLNILQRLIIKKVWKQKKVWEGFIRCCQRAKPQSFQVLLQLPAAQLKDVFEVCPDLREPLLAHVQGFTDNQKSHINKAVMSVLEDAEIRAEMADAEKKDHVNIGKEREKDVVHKIQSMTDSAPQKMSTLTVVKTVDNAPSVSEPVKEKTGSIKISFSSNKGGEKSERKRSSDREFSKERRKDDEKYRDDKSEEDHSSRRSSKGSKKEDKNEEESKAKSSSSSSSSTSKSKLSSTSSRRYTSSSSKKK